MILIGQSSGRGVSHGGEAELEVVVSVVNMYFAILQDTHLSMRVLFSALVMTLGIASVSAQSIDAEASRVDFSVSNMKVNKVGGTFTGMTGSIAFDEASPESANFNVCVDATSVNSGNKKRDDHLRTDDFFHVEEYPQICIQSKSVRKTDAGYLLDGSLTMHGITQAVSIPFSYSAGTFSGSFSIDRKDYEVGARTGSFMVGKEVNLDITAVVK